MSAPTTRTTAGCVRSLVGITGYLVTLVGLVMLIAAVAVGGAVDVVTGALTTGCGVALVAGSYVGRSPGPRIGRAAFRFADLLHLPGDDDDERRQR